MNEPEAQHRIGGILDQAPCGFLRFGDDGTVLRVNSTLVKMLDLPAVEVEGKPVSHLFDQGGKVFFQTHFFPTLRMHGKVKELYLSLKCKDGSKIPVLINAVRSEEEDGIFNDCIIVGIAERERFEDALLQAKKEAEEAKRSNEKALIELKAAMDSLALAKEEADAASLAKDAFLAALSHELRTPLTPVLLTASELEKNESLSPDVREQMSMMRRNIELEATLIDDLLDVSRIRHGKLTLNRSQVDLHEILKQTEEIVLHDFENKGVTMSLRANAAFHHVNGDPARIEQVIWNLLKNAVKFTPENGTVAVATRNDEENRIIVEVKDSGVGIPRDLLSTIFNRFEQGNATGKHRFGGLGLGLSISEAIVAAHEGEIRAESEGEGKGATFSFSLDTIEKPDVPCQQRCDDSRPVESLNILLVEDHESTRLVISRMLSRMNHVVTDVGTLEAARDSFASGVIDLVISDLGLPDGNGLDLMREIRADSNVPAIALSGFGMPEDVQRIKDVGFTSHLIKPVKVDKLISMIGDICDSTGRRTSPQTLHRL